MRKKFACMEVLSIFVVSMALTGDKPTHQIPTTPFEMANLNAPHASAVEHAADLLLGAAFVIRNMDVADGVFVSYRANAIERLERDGKRLAHIAHNLRVEDCALALALDAKGLAQGSTNALESLADYSEDVASDVELVRSFYVQASRLLS